MTPERWQRVKELFSQADAMAESERQAYLNEACRGDDELLAEVHSLLNAHHDDNAILDRPALSYLDAEALLAAADPWLGKRVGAYELVALVGRGGMGAVYRARRVDTEYEKEVAIKLVPGAYHATYVLQRLRSERQILANLDHPNIARLIDGGATADGLPYLVMELVEGESFDRFCDARKLSLRERLHLFCDVCSAVSYAHQRLVVHRDLKPGNILVTADGTVKLLDFGIAKLMQPSLGDTGPAPTVTLMQALTPGFASPEQLLGKPITTSTDIYSLGVVLYHLLTGRSPYRSKLDTAQDAIREVCEAETERPGAVARLDRDLDAITLRALRKEPERRYRSVDELSEDIRRFLAGRPVLARGDRVSYRAGKFLRRRKLEIGAASLVALALVGAVVVSMRQASIAEQQRVRAERHFGSVRKLADVFMFRLHEAIKELPGSIPARELLVNTSLEYLGTLSQESGDDLALRQELASAYEKVADIQGEAYRFNTGKPREALESYTKAASLLNTIVVAEPDNRPARAALARVELARSRLLLLLAEPAQSIAASERSIALYEALVAEKDSDRDLRRGLATAYSVHSYNLDMGKRDEDSGVPYALKAVAMLEPMLRETPEDQVLLAALNGAYSNAAGVIQGSQSDAGRIDRSLELFAKALALSEKLLAATGSTNANHTRLVVADLVTIAVLLQEKSDHEGSLTLLRRAGRLLAGLGSDASNAQLRFDTTFIPWHSGRALLALGRLAEAERAFSQNYETLTAIARDSDTLQVQFLLGGAAWGMGEVYSRQDRWGDAKPWYEKAVPAFKKVTDSVKLDHIDQRTVDSATAGLARSEAELRASH